MLQNIKKTEEVTNGEEVEESNDGTIETPESGESEVEPERQVFTEEGEEKITFDPMALSTVKHQLRQRQESIEQGYDYAISAYVLLDSVKAYSFPDDNERIKTLSMLLFSVINHGKLSAKQVWHLYLVAIPELVTDSYNPEDTELDKQSCQAPWMAYCPPKTVFRTSEDIGVNITYPPAEIFEEAEKLCAELNSIASLDSMCTAEGAIPTEIHDGFFGYHNVFPREEDDVLSKLFEKPGDDSAEWVDLLSMQEKIQGTEADLDELRRRIRDIEDFVGGQDGNETFGPDGELHSFKNECFKYEAAKYIYELCLFKSAKQKESDSHGGTHLGGWTSPKVVESELGRSRVWSWVKGAKCWNGPERSAEAIVSCGAETKILSADEPETCKYVFEVESPVACDEEFRALHQL